MMQMEKMSEYVLYLFPFGRFFDALFAKNVP